MLLLSFDFDRRSTSPLIYVPYFRFLGTCPGQSNSALTSDQSTITSQHQAPSTPPIYSSILVSITGDSKISLQHASVQQLTVIPEGRELVLPPTPAANASGGGQSPQIYSDEEDGGERSPYNPVDYDDDDEDGGGGIRDLIEEVDEDENEDELEPTFLIQDPAPDGGYGWVIVLASFMSNLIVDGIAYTFGLLVDILVNEFNSNTGTVTLCASLLSGFYLSVGKFLQTVPNFMNFVLKHFFNFIGPVVSALANRFGCRAVGISGAMLAAAALFLSTLSPNITMLIIVYGILGGCGFGMIYLPALVSVGYYFNTKRAFATGIAVCGSGVGALVFAPLVSYMLNIMTWRQTFLILGSLVLLCAFFAFLIRPLELHAQTVLEVEDEVIMGDEEDEEEDTDGQVDGNGSGRNQMYRKPLMQRIAEEKRRRMLSHSNSQFLLMMQQNGSIDVHDPAYSELRTRLMMNTEPGVHSTLYLDQLFGGNAGSGAGVVHGWGTPSRTSTPSLQSAHQSMAQLGDNISRQQLSPIIEKKLTETLASAVASNDQLTNKGNNSSGDESSEEDETITIVAKPPETHPGIPSFEPPEDSEKKEEIEKEEMKTEKEESDIVSQLSIKLDIPESIVEEPELEEEEVDTKTTTSVTTNRKEEEKDIVSIVSEKTPTNSARGSPQKSLFY